MNSKNCRSVTRHDVISVCPATGLKAVYVIESESQPGRYRLECQDVHFVAVVTVVEELRSIRGGRLLDKLQHHNRVVALEMSEGYFAVCDDASNFIGLIRDGQNAMDLYIPSEYPLEVKES